MKATSKVLNILFGIVILGFIGYQFYKMPKFSDGEVAPGFEAKLMDGSDFKLSNLQGRYVLLDFWGSWCGPCRKENPELVKLHAAYNGKIFSDAKGFEIVSVALESKEANWKRAIEKDGLNWKYHIVQLERMKGPIALQYGVKEIPTKYLLDTRGEVLMVNPSIGELNKFFQER